MLSYFQSSYALSTDMLHKYRNGGLTLTLGNPKINYVEGFCVGGGSEVNAGLYHRTPQHMLEKWQKTHQLKGVDNHQMDPHFETCEKILGISYAEGQIPEVSKRLDAGAKQLNWQSLEIPRWVKTTNSDGKIEKQTMSKTCIAMAQRQGSRCTARAGSTNGRSPQSRQIPQGSRSAPTRPPTAISPFI